MKVTKIVYALILSCIILMSELHGQIQIPPTRYFDLIHTELSVRPLWTSHQLKGEAFLTLLPYYQPQSRLELDAKSFQIEKLEIVKRDGNTSLNYQYDGKKLIVSLDKSYSKKDTLKVHIVYTANPDSVKAEDGKAITEEKGLYFINTDGSKKNVPTHLWTQGETQANSCWFPTIDYPYEKHTQQLTVTYEDKYVSLSNGKLVSTKKNLDGTKTDVWIQKLPHAVYLSVLVVGDYKIVKDQWRGKEVSYYMEPKYETMARPIFGRTVEMLDFFSKKLGVDFPWDKYAQVIVHEFVAGAMENTTAVTFNTMFQKDARELIDENDDETVAHELFHHWFGDLVTCESWTHLTLNESFANYSEYLWYEYKYGKDEAEYHWTRDMAPYFSSSFTKTEPLIRYDYEKADDMFDVISYNKGGKIVHMLRKYLGDETFFKSLQLYLTRFSYKTAEYDDLRKCFEEVSGEDLAWYFNQWYLKGGHPMLTSSYKKYTDSTILTISQKHNFDSTFIYRLPLDIDIYTGDIVKRKRIWLTKEKDSFPIYEKDIHCISIDGTNSLVGQKTEVRELDDWLYILKNSESYTDQSTAIKKLKNHRSKEKVKEGLYECLSAEKDRTVTSAIRMLDEKWLSKEKRWNEKLLEIAMSKRKGSTRAAAIDFLGKNDSIQPFKNMVMKTIQDSSYLVEEASFKLLVKLDSLLALEYGKKKTQSKSFGMLNSIFGLLSDSKDGRDLQLFEDAIENADGYKKVAIYMNYGKFLAYMPKTLIDKKLLEFDKMIVSKDEVVNYCAKSVLKSMKKEFGKKDDDIAKSRVKEIDAILAKSKTDDNQE